MSKELISYISVFLKICTSKTYHLNSQVIFAYNACMNRLIHSSQTSNQWLLFPISKISITQCTCYSTPSLPSRNAHYVWLIICGSSSSENKRHNDVRIPNGKSYMYHLAKYGRWRWSRWSIRIAVLQLAKIVHALRNLLIWNNKCMRFN